MAGPYLTNPLEQINQAWQQGRNMAFQDAAGKALTSTGPEQQTALTQATQLNPTGSLDLQQKNQQVTGQRLVSMARFLVNAPPEQRDAAYQAMKPALGQLGIDPSTLPANYDDTVAKTAQSLVQAYTPYNAIPAAVRTDQYFTQNLDPTDLAHHLRIKAGLDARATADNWQTKEVPDANGNIHTLVHNARTNQWEEPDFSSIQNGNPDYSAAPARAPTPAGAGWNTTVAKPDAAQIANSVLDRGGTMDEAAAEVQRQVGPNQVTAIHINPATGRFENLPTPAGATPTRLDAAGNEVTAPAVTPTAATEDGGVPTDSTVSPDGQTVTVRPQPGAEAGPTAATSTAPAVGRLGIKMAPKSSLQEKIDIARSLGATNDDIKQMVLGRGAAPDASETGLSDDALNNLAWDYALNGKLPPVGRGGAGQAQRTAVINATADLAKKYGVSPQDLATTAGRNKAFQASLSNTQKQTDTIDRASETFHKNADLMQQLADQVGANGPQAWNQFVINVKNKVTTDPTVAAYLAAQQTASQEYAKVASGATGAAGSTDSAREHANQVINAFQTPDQLRGVLQTLRTDTDNQRQVAHDKLQEIRHNMRVFGTSADNEASSTTAAAPATSGEPAKVSSQAEFDALPSGALFINPKDGKTYRKH